MDIIEEKIYKIVTDKNNEMELYLRNHNNEELSFTLFSNNQKPSKKYELRCNLEEFQKNRFFKIFISVEEIIKEFENKIEKSKFLEDTNCIIIEIQIGLIIINEIILVIEEEEKTDEEKINELTKNKKEMEKIIDNLKIDNENLLKNIEKLNKEHQKIQNDLNKKIEEEKENIQKLNKDHQNEIEKLKNELIQKFKNENEISQQLKTENQKEIEKLKNELNEKEEKLIDEKINIQLLNKEHQIYIEKLKNELNEKYKNLKEEFEKPKKDESKLKSYLY